VSDLDDKQLDRRVRTVLDQRAELASPSPQAFAHIRSKAQRMQRQKVRTRVGAGIGSTLMLLAGGVIGVHAYDHSKRSTLSVADETSDEFLKLLPSWLPDGYKLVEARVNPAPETFTGPFVEYFKPTDGSKTAVLQVEAYPSPNTTLIDSVAKRADGTATSTWSANNVRVTADGPFTEVSELKPRVHINPTSDESSVSLTIDPIPGWRSVYRGPIAGAFPKWSVSLVYQNAIEPRKGALIVSIQSPSPLDNLFAGQDDMRTEQTAQIGEYQATLKIGDNSTTVTWKAGTNRVAVSGNDVDQATLLRFARGLASASNEEWNLALSKSQKLVGLTKHNDSLYAVVADGIAAAGRWQLRSAQAPPAGPCLAMQLSTPTGTVDRCVDLKKAPLADIATTKIGNDYLVFGVVDEAITDVALLDTQTGEGIVDDSTMIVSEIDGHRVFSLLSPGQTVEATTLVLYSDDDDPQSLNLTEVLRVPVPLPSGTN
jgi:hypothetical protein